MTGSTVRRLDVQRLTVSIDDVKCLSSILVISGRDDSYVFVGNQVREGLVRWVIPPDPSTNHNIACGIQLGGTAQWFFRGAIFRDWKTTSSLLWIHGKRMFSLLVSDALLMSTRILSGIWEEHPLVSHSSC